MCEALARGCQPSVEHCDCSLLRSLGGPVQEVPSQEDGQLQKQGDFQVKGHMDPGLIPGLPVSGMC